MIQEKERKIEFDILKGIAIYLVILGHVIQYITDKHFYNNNLWCIIYTFHMPLFLIISGFFFNINNITPTNSNLFLRSKFNQLIYPGIVVSIIILLIDIFNGHTYLPLRLFLCELWFLKALFIIFCICTLFKCTTKWKFKSLILLTTLFLFFYFPFDYWGITYALPFFIAGIFIKNNYSSIKANVSSIFIISFIIFLIFSLLWNKNYLLYHAPYELTYYSIIKAIFRYLYGTNIVLLILASTIIICKDINKNRYTNLIINIGQNTLYIYIIQYIILEKYLKNIEYSTNNQFLDNLIVAPFIAIISLLIFNYIANITLKNMFLRQYLWRKQ